MGVHFAASLLLLVALAASVAADAVKADSGALHGHMRQVLQSSGSTGFGTSRVLSNGCVCDWKYMRDKSNPSSLDGPFNGCSYAKTIKLWCMLPAYISGTVFEGISWKYTDNPSDPDCLTNWTYYEADGSVLEANIARTTMAKSDRRWCALPTSVTGGPEGKTWKFC